MNKNETNETKKKNSGNTKTLTVNKKTNWGIGIEHEMRIRFKKNISEFPADFVSKFFPFVMEQTLRTSSGYIFLNSYSTAYYFQWMKVPISKYYFKYAQSEEEIEFSKEMIILYDLMKKAKAKELYPLDNPLYFKRSNDPLEIKQNRNRICFFISIFCLYHHPLLFYDIHHKNYEQNNISLRDLWDYEYQIENIMDNKVFDNFMTDFTAFYNGDFYQQFKEKLNVLLTTFSIKEMGMDTIKIEKNDVDYLYQRLTLIDDLNISNMTTDQPNITYKDITQIERKYNDILRAMLNEKNNFGFVEDSDEKANFYKTCGDLYRNNLPYLDLTSLTTCLEFVTTNYRKTSFETQYNELKNYEDTFFHVINHIPIFKKFVDVLGEISYHNTGSVGQVIEVYDIMTFDYNILEPDYTGSYHIWITPPYHPDTTMTRFMEECATLANKFQLIEPLIAGHFTAPSVDAFGDNGKLARTSLRQFIGNYSNYGSSDISFLMGTPTHFINEYYVSENDMREAVEKGKSNEIYAVVKTPVYNYYGKPVLNFGKLEERRGTSKLYKDFGTGNINSKPPANVQDYYSVLFQKSSIRPFSNYKTEGVYDTLVVGPDIRTKSYNVMNRPLSDGWKEVYFKKNNRFIIAYVNPEEKKISYSPVYDKNKYRKLLSSERIGIELRVFDHFPTFQLQQILRILAGLTYQSFIKPYRVTSENMYIHEQWWHNEMANVIMKGFEYKPSYEYLRNLSKEFGISEIRLPQNVNNKDVKQTTYTEMVFEMIYRRLDLKYRKNKIYDELCFKDRKMKFESLNRKTWLQIFTDFLLQNPSYYRKLKEKENKNKEIKNEDIINVLGPRYNHNINRIKHYMKKFNITNNNMKNNNNTKNTQNTKNTKNTKN